MLIDTDFSQYVICYNNRYEKTKIMKTYLSQQAIGVKQTEKTISIINTKWTSTVKPALID